MNNNDNNSNSYDNNNDNEHNLAPLLLLHLKHNACTKKWNWTSESDVVRHLHFSEEFDF